MGGAVSTGQDNDDLINNLLEAGYIKTPLVEKVFRAVDRAEYFLPDSRNDAYKDLAWKRGNLHLSAPCIYSEVMEELCLSPGQSFLNLGSGTGYLSTMVGLILGTNGINHGVEIYDDVIAYATKKLDDFKKYSGAIDEYDFCEPKFVQGNCLCLSSDTRQYDRVYCGAVCPEPYENYMKNLLKVGGILVMPLNDQLLQIRRTSETSWDVRSVLPVSFATLIQPIEGKHEIVNLLDVEPLTLQALCRTAIRNLLRKNIDYEYPNLKSVPTAKKAPKKKRVLRRLVVPLFDSSEDSSDDELRSRNNNRNRDLGRVRLDSGDSSNNDNNNQSREVGTLIDFFLDRLRDRGLNTPSTHQWLGRGEQQQQQQQQRTNESNHSSDVEKTETATRNDDANPGTNESDVKIPEDDEAQETVAMNVELPPECATSSTSKTEEMVCCDSTVTEKMDMGSLVENKSSRLTEVEAVIEHDARQAEPPANNDFPPQYEDDVMSGIQEVIVGVLNEIRRERGISEEDEDEEESEAEAEPLECSHEKAGTSLIETEESKDATNNKGAKSKREKFDSGLGDEIIEKDATNSADTSSDLENVMEIDSHSSSGDEENQEERPNKRGSSGPQAEIRRLRGKWRRITLTSHCFDSSSENETGQDEVKPPPPSNEIRTVPSSYTALMKSKIQELPLPPVLKNYLNFYREF